MVKNVEKAIEISDAKIQYVSLVDKAANKRRFLIAKSKDGRAEFSTTGRILKADGGTHYLTGVVYEPMVEDTQGNFMTEDEVKKAAHWFAKNGDKVDLQHSFEAADGLSVVETYVAPCDMQVGGAPVKKGAWVMTVEVDNDDVWQAVEKGEITGFSMGGTGRYGECDVEVEKKHGALQKVASAFGGQRKSAVEKAGRKVSAKNRTTLQEIYDQFGDFLDGVTPEDEREDDWDEEALQELQRLSSRSVQKAGRKVSAKNRAALKAIYDKLGDFLDGVTPEDERAYDWEESARAELQGMVAESVEKAMNARDEAPTRREIETFIEETVETAVEKAVAPIRDARGLSSNLNAEQAVRKEEKRHYLAGIL